jgi:hypothetical protein
MSAPKRWTPSHGILSHSATFFSMDCGQAFENLGNTIIKVKEMSHIANWLNIEYIQKKKTKSIIIKLEY